jgi:D-glycero-D-manno-heptose 1,7-bisphosphate phosphatase
MMSNSSQDTSSLMKKRPTLFLDRDGVINVDRGYVDTPDDFEFIPGAIDVIKAFKDNGWFVFVVTNQTGIAHGYYTEEDMLKVHAHMQAELIKAGTRIDKIYYCPFDIRAAISIYQRESSYRKPNPGMILKAMKEYPVDRDKSLLIGDKTTDVEAAKNANILGYQFMGGDLMTFVQKISPTVGFDLPA